MIFKLSNNHNLPVRSNRYQFVFLSAFAWMKIFTFISKSSRFLQHNINYKERLQIMYHIIIKNEFQMKPLRFHTYFISSNTKVNFKVQYLTCVIYICSKVLLKLRYAKIKNLKLIQSNDFFSTTSTIKQKNIGFSFCFKKQ